MFWNFDLVLPQGLAIFGINFRTNAVGRDKTKERIQKTEILTILFEKIEEEKMKN